MKTFNFVGKFKVFIAISIAIIVVGVIFGAVNGGLNLGIDFSGGSITTIEVGQEYDVEVINDALVAHSVTDAPVVKSGDGYTQAIIRMQDLGGDQEQTEIIGKVLASIQETYPNAEIDAVDRVGGVASAELVRNALLAVIVACILMLIYIWIRFELFSGIAAVVALVHDVLIM
ncbi:MAG: protein translocase subunit SecF, partial [Christensenellaceae bacterium]